MLIAFTILCLKTQYSTFGYDNEQDLIQSVMSRPDTEQNLIESVIRVSTETYKEVCSILTEYLKFHEIETINTAGFVKRLTENAVLINHKNSELIIQLFNNSGYDISQKIENKHPHYEAGTPEYYILNDDVDSLQNILSRQDKPNLIPISTLFPDLFPSTSVNLLQFSAFCGSTKCFKYLLSECKNIETKNDIEFYAAAGGNHEIIGLVKGENKSFNECIEVCVAYHRNDILKTLIKEMGTTKIPASIFVQSLNEEAVFIIYESLSDIDMKYTFLEEILDEPSSKCLPQFRKSIEEKLKSTSDEFRTYITDTYVARYKSEDVKKVNFDDLKKQEMKSSHFKLAVFFRVKGISDSNLKSLIEKQSDPKAENKRQKALKRALDLIAVGDIKHISPLNGKNKTRISSLNDIIRILPEWENGTTVFSMKDQFGDISGDSFKQRVQKSGLCYMNAVVVYLYYAVRRNNKTWGQVIDMSEMIKKNFSGDKISDYIFKDGGGSTYDLLDTFAMSIKEKNPSIKPRVKIISPEDVTEELFIDHGPFVLFRFKVYDDFYNGTKLSYTDDSFVNGDPIGRHAMLVIGIRKNSDGEFIFLVQNWWEGKQIVEMSSEYLANHSASFAYIDGFNLTDYTNIDITSTTVTPFVETTVDKPETLLLERF